MLQTLEERQGGQLVEDVLFRHHLESLLALLSFLLEDFFLDNFENLSLVAHKEVLLLDDFEPFLFLLDFLESLALVDHDLKDFLACVLDLFEQFLAALEPFSLDELDLFEHFLAALERFFLDVLDLFEQFLAALELFSLDVLDLFEDLHARDRPSAQLSSELPGQCKVRVALTERLQRLRIDQGPGPAL